jgi:hypothetical protein
MENNESYQPALVKKAKITLLIFRVTWSGVRIMGPVYIISK